MSHLTWVASILTAKRYFFVADAFGPQCLDLKFGFNALGGQGRVSLAGELFDCVIEYRHFSLFEYVPDGLATVDAVVGTLMAVLTKGYTGVLEPLLYVVGIRGF